MEHLQIKDLLSRTISRFGGPFVDLLDEVAANTTVLHLRAGERFPKTGEEIYQAGCIVEGTMRVYSKGEQGQETIIRLLSEGDFTVYLADFKFLNPSDELAWEAITDLTMMAWTTEGLDQFAQKIPNWNSLILQILKTMMLMIAIERAEMFSDDATTRYTKFAQRNPHLISRVPLRYIANYLGITPQSLSRIRQQLAKTAI